MRTFFKHPPTPLRKSLIRSCLLKTNVYSHFFCDIIEPQIIFYIIESHIICDIIENPPIVTFIESHFVCDNHRLADQGLQKKFRKFIFLFRSFGDSELLQFSNIQSLTFFLIRSEETLAQFCSKIGNFPETINGKVINFAAIPNPGRAFN